MTLIPSETDPEVETTSSELDTETGDTGEPTEEHTPEEAAPAEVDIDALLTQLEANRDKIPPEKLQFLNPDLQKGYTRRLNLLNRGAETAVKHIVSERGIKIPEGKTALDLLTDGNGEEFLKLIRGQVAEEVKPLTDIANEQKANANISQMVALAVNTFPEVKDNAQAVINMIDGDPELTELSKAFEGKALPYVMRGVAASIEANKLKAEVARLNGLLKSAKVVKTTGTETSRAGGNRPTGEAPPPGKGRLDWAINKGMEKLEAEA